MEVDLHNATEFTVDDAQRVRSLLSKAFWAEKLAITRSDDELLRRVNRLVLGILYICQLRSALRRSDGQVRGGKGAAGVLGLSRNGIYSRIECVGLEIDDLRDSDAPVADLIQKSKTLGPLAREVCRLQPQPEKPRPR